MEYKVYILTEAECEEILLEAFKKHGFEVVGVNDLGSETVDLLFCYKMTREGLKQKLEEIQQIQYNALAIAYLFEDVKEVFCNKPTLIIKDDSQLAKTNIFQKIINKDEIGILVKETCEWFDILAKDIKKYGVPLFYKIKSEEVSCRMISFDEQYPIEFKLV